MITHPLFQNITNSLKTRPCNSDRKGYSSWSCQSSGILSWSLKPTMLRWVVICCNLIILYHKRRDTNFHTHRCFIEKERHLHCVCNVIVVTDYQASNYRENSYVLDSLFWKIPSDPNSAIKKNESPQNCLSFHQQPQTYVSLIAINIFRTLNDDVSNTFWAKRH